VDFVYDDARKIIPIEVKYREHPSKFDGLIEFMEMESLDSGIVVTKDIFKKEDHEGRKILFIPTWFFLLMFQ